MSTSSLWQDPSWRAEALAWVRASAGRAAAVGHGALLQELHVRPWSAVFRVAAEGGGLIFKATSAATRHEAAVVMATNEWAAHAGPVVVAAEADKGWILMNDAGSRLRDLLVATPDLAAWREILPQYAAMQIESVAQVPALLGAGVPDHRAQALFHWYEDVVHDANPLLRVGQAEGLFAQQIRDLVRLGPVLGEAGRELARILPSALNHGNLHDGNIFHDHGRWRFLDWGDSCISHPLYSLRTVKVSAETRFQLEEGSRQVDALTDAYLEPWTGVASRGELREALALSEVMAPLSGAMTWAGVISEMDGETRDRYRAPVPALLEEALNMARLQGSRPRQDRRHVAQWTRWLAPPEMCAGCWPTMKAAARQPCAMSPFVGLLTMGERPAICQQFERPGSVPWRGILPPPIAWLRLPALLSASEGFDARGRPGPPRPRDSVAGRPSAPRQEAASHVGPPKSLAALDGPGPGW